MSNESVPIVDDITFRLSEGGEMVGIDFECRDGSTRALAMSIAGLPKLFAGLLWAGAESGMRRPAPALPPAVREALHDGARELTGWRVSQSLDGSDAILELESGAAVFCIRVPSAWLRDLGHHVSGGAGEGP
jgi:hypothetical protein